MIHRIWNWRLLTADFTANIRFADQDFVVSIIVNQEDFEASNDNLLAPQSKKNHRINILIIIIPIIIIHNGKNKYI
jgi:hypothetical protein